MISEIELRHFKCFELLKLPLGKLTVLSGVNSSGKSSVLQALALVSQTMREHEWANRLFLNGDAIRLGTVADVVDEIYGRNELEMTVSADSGFCNWRFAGERDEMSLSVEYANSNGTVEELPNLLHWLVAGEIRNLPFINTLRDLTYITAERVGPREVYPLEDLDTASVVGPQGEYSASLLHWGRDKEVLPQLAIPDVPNVRLRQVEARLQSFFPGCAIDLQHLSQTNAVTLGLRTSVDTNFHRPIHVGFGITQVLPIVIAALSAEKESLLLIENPEVHLHPAGQMKMGVFLAEVARAGIQVVLETHSDHVISGLRRAVRSTVLAPGDVSVHFFRARGSSDAQVVTPALDPLGNFDEWPTGFFDQFDRDASHFAGWTE